MADPPPPVPILPGIKPPQQFSLGSNPTDNWKLFKQRWEAYTVLSRLPNQARETQVALLKSCLADDALRTLTGFKFETADDARTVAEIMNKFEEFVVGALNETYERYVFNRRNQTETETFDAYLADLRSLQKTCNYCGNCGDSLLRDRIVFGVRSEEARSDLFKERGLTLQKTIDICRTVECALTQHKALKPATDSVNKVSSNSTRHKSHKQKKPWKGKTSVKTSVTPTEKQCKFCGRVHLMKKEMCPAWGKTCDTCNGKNHFASKCPTTSENKRKRERSGKVHGVAEVDDDDSEVEWLYAVEPEGADKSKQLKCKLIVGGQCVTFQIDTGASVNILPAKYASDLEVVPTDKKLKMWNSATTTPVGVCRKVVCNPKNQKKYNIEFTVVQQAFTPLLGLKTATQMGLIKIVERNVERVAAVRSQSVTDGYPSVWDAELGYLPGEVRLQVKPDAIPVVMPDRRIAISLRDKLMTELDRMESMGVIAKVTDPTPWVNQIVIVPKKSGEIRVCIDPRELNKVLVRERFTMPILEDKVHEMGHSTVFSKADLKAGYWHVLLDEESSLLTTFQTIHGRYRWKRLPFGLSVSAEIFQRKLLEALRGLDGVVCIADDVVIHGKDESEHDKHLEAFLQRCAKIGIKLNKDKLDLRKSEVTFMGHVVSAAGLHTDPEKVRAIVQMAEPTDVPSLRRFLGTVNYLGKFLPNLSDTLTPLTNLLKQDTPWNWSSAQEVAFAKAKQLVTSAPVLAFYDPAEPLVLENDASSYGLGTAMYQGGKPIAFASRTLTPAETRYAQLEKEMLAVCFGLTKFHHYTYGRDVQVITDHKPLVSIVGKPLDKAPKRLQNLLLRTLEYNFDLVYRTGKSIPVADTLSRSPLPTTQTSEVVHTVFAAPVRKESLAKIKAATAIDETLLTLKHVILSGWPDHKCDVDPSIRSYFDHRDEMSVHDGVILRGERIIIPQSLQLEVKTSVHAGHMGINSCLRRARESLYWPGMSKDIRQFVEQCSTCNMHACKQQQEPLILKEVPSHPFSVVATDLFYVKGREYLVLVDLYSNFIEVDYMCTSTSEDVIAKLKQHFARYGIPNVVYSDNGPQYASACFAKFAEKWQFQHVTSSPGNSQSNGAAEAAVKIVKLMMLKCAETKDDPYLGLLSLRNTPTEGLSTSPSQRLLGRKTRTLVPILVDSLKSKMAPNENDRMELKKHKSAQYRSSKTLKPISNGMQVRIQPTQPGTKTWSKGTVTGRMSARSYEVVTERGTILRRNRRLLRPVSSESDHTNEARETFSAPVQDHVVNQNNAPQQPPKNTPQKLVKNAPQQTPKNTPQKQTPTQCASSTPVQTRSGREIRLPARYND
jgi:transposase InsO family protein